MNFPESVPPLKPVKLLDQLRAKTRLLHDRIRNEAAYVGWVTKSVVFHGKRHPETMGAAEIEAFHRTCFA